MTGVATIRKVPRYRSSNNVTHDWSHHESHISILDLDCKPTTQAGQQTAAKCGMHGCVHVPMIPTITELHLFVFSLNSVKCHSLLAVAEWQKPAHSACLLVRRACSTVDTNCEHAELHWTVQHEQVQHGTWHPHVQLHPCLHPPPWLQGTCDMRWQCIGFAAATSMPLTPVINTL